MAIGSGFRLLPRTEPYGTSVSHVTPSVLFPWLNPSFSGSFLYFASLEGAHQQVSNIRTRCSLIIKRGSFTSFPLTTCVAKRRAWDQYSGVARACVYVCVWKSGLLFFLSGPTRSTLIGIDARRYFGEKCYLGRWLSDPSVHPPPTVAWLGVQDQFLQACRSTIDALSFLD